MTGDADQRVVVAGVDGSPESVEALRWAGRYAALTGAALRAVWVWHYPSAVGPTPPAVAPESVSADVEQQTRQQLATAIDQAGLDAASGQVEARVAFGHPAQVLVDESKSADLLAVGSRGHGAFTGMLIGSVSIHCATHANCPVVVVRGTAD